MSRFWIYLFCLGPIISDAQIEHLDSLINLLEHPESSIHEIDINIGLARIYMLSRLDTQEGIVHAEAALQVARDINSKKYEAIALTFIGMLKFNLAKSHCETLVLAMEIGKNSKDPNAIAFSTYPWIESCSYDSPKNIMLLENLIAEHGSTLSRKNLGNVHKVIAYEYEKEGRFEEGEQAYKEAIKIFKAMRTSIDIDPDLGFQSIQTMDQGLENLFQSRVYLGQLYAKMGRYEDGVEYVQIALQSSQDESNIAYASLQLATIYQQAGQYAEAISAYDYAIQSYRESVEYSFLSSTLSRLGGMYVVMEEYEEAEKRYIEALDLANEKPNDAAGIMAQLAHVYNMTDRRQLSITSYMSADSIFESLGNQLERINCQLSIASLQSEEGNYELAIQRILNQIPIIENTKDIILLHGAYYRLAKVEERRTNYNKALEYGYKGYNIALASNNNINLLSQSHELLSILYEKVENYKEALAHHQKFQVYKDKLYTDNALENLKKEQVRQNINEFEEDKEQAEAIATLLSQQNKVYLAVAGLLLTLLGIGTYLFFQLRQTRKQLENQNLQLQDLNHTKDRFFGIIAHDIRSPILALESVDEQMDYYAAKGDTPKLQKLSKMVGTTARQLNSLLDNLLNWALVQTGNIPYKPEALNIYDIVEEGIEMLSNNALMKDILLENQISKDLKVNADERAIQTIIRNLLSNAIKFSSKGDQITLLANPENEFLSITVSDTGLGMTVEKIQSLFTLDKKSQKGTAGEKGTGLGLVLVRDLVKLNKGALSIKSMIGEGTSISFTLPIV